MEKACQSKIKILKATMNKLSKENQYKARKNN